MINTDKRLISLFTAFCMVIGALCLRMYDVFTRGTEYVASETHYFTVDVDNVRGEILDRHGERLTDVDYDTVAVLKPTLRALSAVDGVITTEMYDSLKERMEKGCAVSVNIGGAQIAATPDIALLKKYQRVSEAQPAAHLIGYLDSEGRGVTGIEKSFDDILFSGKRLSVRFPADAWGRIISGEAYEIQNYDIKTGYVMLTIDSEIQRITENALNMYAVKEGGAVVIETATGAVRAMASRPIYNSSELERYINAEGSPMVNRGLNAYAVGSVFKAAVAAAALENGISDFEYNCTGSCEVGGTVFGCNNRKAHGKLDMQKALECSCNTYFINLAEKTGAENLLETVKKFGFGQELSLADGLASRAGTLPTEDKLKKPGELANFSFGQGDFTATMLQLAQLFSAIAGDGKYLEPYVVEKSVTADGVEKLHRAKYPVVAISKSTANRLSEMLVSVVENGNASKAKPTEDFRAAGKTATAQTGTFTKYGTEICNTWFCGFFPADDPEYTVVILKQGGSSGAEDCAPVFSEIADKIFLRK